MNVRSWKQVIKLSVDIEWFGEMFLLYNLVFLVKLEHNLRFKLSSFTSSIYQFAVK